MHNHDMSHSSNSNNKNNSSNNNGNSNGDSGNCCSHVYVKRAATDKGKSHFGSRLG